MMETIANSELHIPTPIHPTPLKQNKDKTENKHKTILLFSFFSHVDCVYTVVTFKCLYPFFCLLILSALFYTVNTGNRILYDMRNGMHLALVILEETNLDIYNII